MPEDSQGLTYTAVIVNLKSRQEMSGGKVPETASVNCHWHHFFHAFLPVDAAVGKGRQPQATVSNITAPTSRKSLRPWAIIGASRLRDRSISQT